MLGLLKKMFGQGVNLEVYIQNGAIVIDVRTAREFSGGHVKGSKNIPVDRIEAKIETIKKWNKPIITCCASGMRSGTAASILKREGIDAVNGGPWTSVNSYYG